MNVQARVNVLRCDLQTEHLQNVLYSVNRSPVGLDKLHQVAANLGNMQNVWSILD